MKIMSLRIRKVRSISRFLYSYIYTNKCYSTSSGSEVEVVESFWKDFESKISECVKSDVEGSSDADGESSKVSQYHDQVIHLLRESKHISQPKEKDHSPSLSVFQNLPKSALEEFSGHACTCTALSFTLKTELECF